MQSDDPAFLTVGTEVSAKFKGAFCEAKVKKVTKSIRIKVVLKESPFGNLIVDENAISKNAKLEINEIVDVIQGKQTLRAVIQNIKDCSKYHVVFNDGDEKELRRTQLCLKGGKHFDAAVNLDALPLYNPEQFSSPVMRGAKGKHNKKRKGDESLSPLKRKKKNDGEQDEEESDEEGSKKREKRAAASAATMAITEISGISAGGDTTEDSSADSSEEREKKKQRKEEEKKEKKKPSVGLHEKFLTPGSCVVIFEESQSAQKIKEGIYASFATQSSEGPSSSSSSPSPSNSSPLSSPKASIPSSLYSVFYKRPWWPAVIVSPSAYKKYSNKLKEEKDKDQIHVRRFSDGKYFIRNVSFMIPFSWLPTFSKKKIEEIRDNRATTSSPSSSSSESVDFSASIDLAYAFVDSEKLPKSWAMREIRGGNSDSPITNRKKEEKKDKEKEKVEERSSEDGSSSEESDTEVTEEERNFFIAQVYKFHEESASPINRVPVLGGKEIDLYQFHRVVQYYGGSKKVTTSGKWGRILKRMGLKGCSGATSVTIKKAYMRYLEPYSSFSSKLGWSAADANSTGPRGERRPLIRPGQLSDNKKQRRKSDAAKNRSSKEGSRRGSKEGSMLNDSIKSESPKPVEDDTRKQGVSESSSADFVDEKLEEELAVKLEEVKKEQSKSRETSITSTSNQLSPKKKKETTPSKKMVEGTPGKEKSIEKEDGEKKKLKKEKYGAEKGGPSTSTCPLNNPTIRQKTERKNVGAIPSTDGSGSGEKGDPDEGYRQSNVISHFYMGQKVRANHSGRWYDARVVEIRQSTTLKIGQLLTQDQTDNFSQETKDELLKAGREMACFVHYLGWNSRYDEWINLSKLKISDKDQHNSRNMIRDQFKTISDIRIAMAEYNEKEGLSFEKILESVKESKEMIAVPVEPTPLVVVNTIEKKSVPIVTVAPSMPIPLPPAPPDNRTSMSPQGFGSPTRVAAMLSAVATSSSEVTVRDVAAMAVGLEARQRGGRVLLGPASSRNQKTLLHQVSSEAGLQALRSSYVPVTTTATYVAAAEPQKEEPNKEEQQKETPKEPEPQIEPEPEPEPQPEREPEPIVQSEEKEPECLEPEPVAEPEPEPEQPKEMFKRVRTSSRNLTPTKEKEQTPEKTDDLRKSARKSTIASSTASINAQKAAAMLAVSGPLIFPMPEKEREKDKTPPKAATPMYLDTPVVSRKLSTPNEPSTSSSLAPPPVTPTVMKGQVKRKRTGRGGNTGIGSVDRKSHGRTPGKKDDDSDDGEEDGESSHHMTPTVSHRADTFHSLKTRMHRLMEQEGSLNDLSILGLPDYDELLRTTREEDLSDVLEARCYELRDIYTQAKSDIVAMEKKKRRFYEKKREKEKKLRGRSMTPAVSTPSTSNDL